MKKKQYAPCGCVNSIQPQPQHPEERAIEYKCHFNPNTDDSVHMVLSDIEAVQHSLCIIYTNEKKEYIHNNEQRTAESKGK